MVQQAPTEAKGLYLNSQRPFAALFPRCPIQNTVIVAPFYRNFEPAAPVFSSDDDDDGEQELLEEGQSWSFYGGGGVACDSLEPVFGRLGCNRSLGEIQLSMALVKAEEEGEGEEGWFNHLRWWILLWNMRGWISSPVVVLRKPLPVCLSKLP